MKNICSFPLYSAPKRNSTLFPQPFYVSTRTSPARAAPVQLARFSPQGPPPHPPGQPPPCPPPPCPLPPCPPTPCPLQPSPASSATCYRILVSVPNFSRVVTVVQATTGVPYFSQVVPDFSRAIHTSIQDFSLVQKLTYCVDATLPRLAE